MSEKQVDNEPAQLPLKIASCCFPIVGLLLYFIWKEDKPVASKEVGKFALIGVVFSVVIPMMFGVLGGIFAVLVEEGIIR